MSKSSASKALVVLSWLVPVGVMAQAALAGQAWFIDPELFGLHGGIGHGVVGLSVILAVWSWLQRISIPGAAMASLAVIALLGQTGMGYAGHRSGIAAASSLHIPLGVAILGLTVAAAVTFTLASRR